MVAVVVDVVDVVVLVVVLVVVSVVVVIVVTVIVLVDVFDLCKRETIIAPIAEPIKIVPRMPRIRHNRVHPK